MALVALTRKKIITGNAVLLVFVAFLFLVSSYQKTLFFRPVSYHQWRQADCLSITKNYYEEGMRFFHPAIHYQGVEGGKAVSECPILNYTVATLWHVFGEHEFIYRLLEYLIFLAAAFILFNTLLRYSNKLWLSLFAVSVMLTSPLLVYYSLNFIADVPALSLAVISFCCIYRFFRDGRERMFYLALATGTLAVLMKASALVPLCITLLTGILGLAGSRVGFYSVSFRKKSWPVAAMLLCATIIVAWYNYAIYYNNNNMNHIFLLTILPIWEMPAGEINTNMKLLFNVHFPMFLGKPMLFLIFLGAAFVMARFRSMDFLLRVSFVVSGVFFICYLLFFFQVFGVHDYYLINIFIFPVIVLFCVVMILGSDVPAVTRFARIFVPAALLLNGIHAAAVYRMRMFQYDPLARHWPFISREETDFADYLFWNNSLDVKRVEYFTPVLREHGISRTDRVLSIPDHSFNVTLYLMDQKGFTVARDHIRNDTTVMDRFMKKVDYVILSDTTLKNEIAFRRTEHNFSPYFTHGPVKVYKMNHVR